MTRPLQGPSKLMFKFLSWLKSSWFPEILDLELNVTNPSILFFVILVFLSGPCIWITKECPLCTQATANNWSIKYSILNGVWFQVIVICYCISKLTSSLCIKEALYKHVPEAVKGKQFWGHMNESKDSNVEFQVHRNEIIRKRCYCSW